MYIILVWKNPDFSDVKVLENGHHEVVKFEFRDGAKRYADERVTGKHKIVSLEE